MSKIRLQIKIEGTVQGVGFRPFIYRLAKKYNLSGWVSNTTEGVEIEVEGEREMVSGFPQLIEEQAPPLAQINRIITKSIAIKGGNTFKIKKSNVTGNTIALIPPDVATCDNCLDDITDPGNRRFRYPFTNCTNCGPRFSIIKGLPYDRHHTTLKKFEMCEECETEYYNPLNRRYHAQPNACPECGPRVWLLDSRGNNFDTVDPVKTVTNLLKQGKIIAVKGLGGFHLTCNAEDERVVAELRKRKKRPDKPLALMMNRLTTVMEYCHVDKKEKDILQGHKKPILLLDKKSDRLPDIIAPGSKYYGVMLPYTPLHYLLFDDDLKVLVATSANISGSSIIYKNENALSGLKDIADFFLFHNRDIYLPVDDSVVRVIMGKERVFRRSRGYVPSPVRFCCTEEGLALGAEQKNTTAISKGDFIFLSQHLGNLSNKGVYDNFKFVIRHFIKLYQLKPAFIAHDLHPDYQSTYHASLMSGNVKKKEIKKIGIQHHHAHIASCVVENGVNEKVIGLAFDGTGLGADGNIWGGEFLICDLKTFNRVGHLGYIKMPGGEKAIKEPWRMAVSHLYKLNYDKGRMLTVLNIDEKELEIVLEMLKKDLNCPRTSSMGRLFDTVAAITGIRKEISYQAQAAIELETAAALVIDKINEFYPYDIQEISEKLVINTDPVIKNLLLDYEKGIDSSIIAGKFHNTIIELSSEMCKLIRSKYSINNVVLSGGVFQNEILLKGLYKKLEEANFKVYTHTNIPCNDGGLSLGQLAIASRREV